MKDFMLNSEGNAGSSQQVTKPTIATGTRETCVKERPILFSGEMVRAILEGRKTQTRRVAQILDNVRVADGVAKGYLPGCPEGFEIKCPYGIPGDRLWVRETWAYYGGNEYLYQRDKSAVFHAATWDEERACLFPISGLTYVPGDRWRPSIHMPRWASRITLEIAEVRVQRVQEITEEDCWSEGIERSKESPIQASTSFSDYASPRRAFNLLWDSINAKRGFGWDANPWVWVISFKPLRTTDEQ